MKLSMTVDETISARYEIEISFPEDIKDQVFKLDGEYSNGDIEDFKEKLISIGATILSSDLKESDEECCVVGVYDLES